MNRKPKVILRAIVALLLLVVPSLFWYRQHYSMTIANSYEAGSPPSTQRVLIATQGSGFKGALVSDVMENLKGRPLYNKSDRCDGFAHDPGERPGRHGRHPHVGEPAAAAPC